MSQTKAQLVSGRTSPLNFPSGNGTSDQVLAGDGAGTLSWTDRGRMTLATAQNTTSGTAIDFTGIPSWVKRVTVMFNGVSTSGTSNLRLRLGTSGGLQATGYAGSTSFAGGGGAGGAFYSVGFDSLSEGTVALERHGALVLLNISGNTWTVCGSYGSTSATTTAVIWTFCGSVTLSGTLDRIRLTTVNGTDTFDAGNVNIMYEG